MWMITLWTQSTVKWFTGFSVDDNDTIAQIFGGNNELLSTLSKIVIKYLKFTIGWHYWCIIIINKT